VSDERSSGYYARIMGTFWRHPRTSGLSLAARGLWVSLVSWSADQRSDGEVPAHAVAMACGGRTDTRALHELAQSDLVTRSGETLVLRNWAKHNITREKHDGYKEKKRVGMATKRARGTSVTGNRKASGTTVSDQDQDQEQEQRSASADLSDAREATRVPVSPEPRAESVTALAERNRRTVAEGYRSRGLAVPRQAASLAGTAEVAASLAGLPPDALPGILGRFFEDRRMREKGFPISYLLTNPNQWATEGPRGRDEGEARERPAATVLPDWLLPKPHPTEAA
jgi:hypothetical protein